MKKILTLIAVCLLTSTSHAGMFNVGGGAGWVGDGTLLDEAVFKWQDINTNNTFDAGDVVQFIQEFRTVGGVADSTSGTTILGVGAFEVASRTFTSNKSIYSFQSLTAANITSFGVNTIISGVNTNGTFQGTAASNPDYALIRRTDGNFSINSSGGSGTSLGLDGSSSTLGITGSQWELEAEASLDGNDDFYEWYKVAGSDPGNLGTISFWESQNDGGLLDGYASKLALSFDRYTSDLAITGDSVSTTNALGGSVDGDIVSLTVANLATTSGTTASNFSGTVNNFDLQTISAIPEPNSLAVILGLSVIGTVSRRRR